MRLVLSLASLLIAVFSVATDVLPVPHDSGWCALGLCRSDQMTASIDQEGMNSTNILTILDQDSGNPLLWSVYGELLAAQGKTEQAGAMYDHAVALGPHMASVLMRAANFDFTHDRTDHGLSMANQILAQADGFDEILFSYIASSRLPLEEVFDRVIPAEDRPARSWLSWLRTSGSDHDLGETFDWMMRHQLADEESAVELTKTLWGRHSYALAQKVWVAWLGDRAGDYLKPDRIWNPTFEMPPTASPFDWVINPPPSVKVQRKNGLEIRFSGTDNLSFSHVQQFVTVAPGRYRFTAEIEASGLTTDQHPLFRIQDAGRPAALNMATEPIETTRGRSTLRLDFTVPQGTSGLQIQLERRMSDRFDNKLAGTVHLYSVSLKPL